jgi:hypothetical protein
LKYRIFGAAEFFDHTPIDQKKIEEEPEVDRTVRFQKAMSLRKPLSGWESFGLSALGVVLEEADEGKDEQKGEDHRDENSLGTIADKATGALPGQDQVSEESGDEKEEGHAEAMGGQRKKIEEVVRAAVLNRLVVTIKFAEGERQVVENAEQHGKGSPCIEVVEPLGVIDFAHQGSSRCGGRRRLKSPGKADR